MGGVSAGLVSSCGAVECSDATSQSECEGLDVEGLTAECIWVARSRYQEEGCGLVDEREECIQVTGTQAGCLQCADAVTYRRAAEGVVDVLTYVSPECGKDPELDEQWELCDESGECGCDCG